MSGKEIKDNNNELKKISEYRIVRIFGIICIMFSALSFVTGILSLIWVIIFLIFGLVGCFGESFEKWEKEEKEKDSKWNRETKKKCDVLVENVLKNTVDKLTNRVIDTVESRKTSQQNIQQAQEQEKENS